MMHASRRSDGKLDQPFTFTSVKLSETDDISMIIKRSRFKVAVSQTLLLWSLDIFDSEAQHFLDGILLGGSHGIQNRWRERRNSAIFLVVVVMESQKWTS